MKAKRLHISQTLFMPSLMKSLKVNGIGVNHLLRTSKLNKFDYSKHENYVPNLLLYDFLYKVQKSQGLNSIVNQFYKDFQLKSGGSFGASFFQQPTLLEGVQGVIKMPFILRTNHKLRFSVYGKKAFFEFLFMDKPSKERKVAEDIAWVHVFDAWRSAIGQNWQPSAIYTTYSSFKHLEDIIPNGDFPIYYNQDSNKIIFPTTQLFEPLIKPDIDFSINKFEPTTFTQQIHQLLKNACDGYFLNLNDTSSFTNLSTRTIKRKLAEEGTTFSELATNVFLKKSTQLLKNSNLTIKEISQILGYQNKSNFARAFKNKLQVTPEQFRCQI